jgi:hypothetical protein
MALASRQDLIDYCLRRLGFPVIEINVDDDQISDRIDDALQFWYEYHFDGRQKTFISHQITGDKLYLASNILVSNFIVGDKLTGQTSGATAVVKNIDTTSYYLECEDTKGTFIAGEAISGSSSLAGANLHATTFYTPGDMGNKYIPVGDGVLSITRMFNFGGVSSGSSSNSGVQMFDLMYQFRQNDMYNLLGADMTYYSMVQSHLTTLEQLLVTQRQIRFNRKQNRVFIDADWDRTFNPGDYVVFEAYSIVDPTEFSEVYDDMFLKKYATALIKRQWGENMKKFGGIQLPGGVTLNGDKIFQEAIDEIEVIERDMQLKYELPPTFMVG